MLDMVFESSNSQSASQQIDTDSVDAREKDKDEGKEGDRQVARDKEDKVAVESDRQIFNGTALVEVDVTDEYLVTGGDSGTPHNAPFTRASLTTDMSMRSSLGREDLQRKRSMSGLMGFGSKKDHHLTGSTVTSHTATKTGSGAHLSIAESDGDLYPVAPAVSPPSSLPFPINISSCRPLFYPSVSGTHCALFWSESSFYVVYQVKLNKSNKIRRCPSADSTSSSRMGSGRMGQAKMSLLSITEDEDLDMSIACKSDGISDSMAEESFIEVDRGRCISFAWVGNGKTYAVLTPGCRGEATVQKRSLFSKSEKEMGHFTPPEMIFKVLPTSNGSGESVVAAVDMLVDISALSTPSAPSSSVYRALPQELHSGPILCITSPREKADSLSGGQKAVSKIEADAIAQQQSEMKKEMMGKEKDKGLLSKKNKSSTASVESIVAASNVSWEESPGGGGEYFRATQTSRFYALTSTHTPSDGGGAQAPSLSLQAVGPSFSAVRSVTWEPSSGLCAVLVGLTVTILRLEINPHTTSGNTLKHSDAHGMKAFNLSIYATVDLHAYVSPLSSLSFSSMISFSWRSGQLFALTSTELLLVCTGHPYLKSTSTTCDTHTHADSDTRRKGKKEVKQKDRLSESHKESHACPITDVLVIASSTPDSIYMKCRGHAHASSQGVDCVGTGTGVGLGPRGGRGGVLSLKDTSGWLDIVGGRKGHLLLSSRYEHIENKMYCTC